MEQKRTVLIVDDDPEIRRQLRWALAEEFHLLLAGDPREAEELLLHPEPPAAAIVDLNQPPDTTSIEGGIWVIQRLRKSSGTTRIIALSADGTKEARR